MKDISGLKTLAAPAMLLAIVSLLTASSAAAAPIYGDVSLEGGIHLWSEDVFIARGYWTTEVTEEEVLSHAFALEVTFDGSRHRVDVSFPSMLVTCGTFQVDAWWHGGWWGELRPTTQSCEEGFIVPQLPPLDDPHGGDFDPRSPDDPSNQVPVPEPASWMLFASGAAFYARRASRQRRPR